MDELLTTAELASYLKIPSTTLAQWRHKGTGPAGIRVGRHVRYPRSAVDAWLRAHTSPAV